MRLVDFITLMDAEVAPQNTKIHLATWNGEEEPRDVYLAGRFDEWQRWQTKRNFERRFVISLISLPGVQRWLYARIHTSEGCDWREDRELYYYRLQERQSCSEFNGRLRRCSGLYSSALLYKRIRCVRATRGTNHIA